MFPNLAKCLPFPKSLSAHKKDRDGRLVAVLQLLNKRRGTFGKDDVTFLAELGAPFALALTTAQAAEA